MGEEVYIREGIFSLRIVKSMMINYGKCWWGEGVWEIFSFLDIRIVFRI